MGPRRADGTGAFALDWDPPASGGNVIGYRVERDFNDGGSNIPVYVPDRRYVSGCRDGGPRRDLRFSLSQIMFLTLYDRLGKRLPTVTGTSFNDLLSDLSNQDRDYAGSLRYHVVALTADGASMPVTLKVDTEPLRRWYSGGISVLDATAYEGTDADLVFEVMVRPKPQGAR